MGRSLSAQERIRTKQQSIGSAERLHQQRAVTDYVRIVRLTKREPLTPLGPRNTIGTGTAPAVMYRFFAAELTI